jgi:4-amino-4-deoxy-L-arabinose transferase-like glycosyltransferase
MPTSIIAEREEGRRTDSSRQQGQRCSASGRPLSCLPQLLIAVLVGLAAFLVYVRTLAPTIIWGDSPELTTAAFTAGVPHPTGYPLYMILSHAFLRVCPLGSVAYRMNLLSALSGGAAVALSYLLLRRVTRSRWSSLVAALLFAVGRTFWSQAVIAEHYPFEMVCIAAALICVLTWDRRGGRRWLWASALIYGLCLTHHMMSLLLAPGLLFLALTSRHRLQFVRELRWTLPLFLLPLALYLYLPLAALRDPPMNWGDPRTWDRFIAHVTGSQYHDLMFQLTRAQLAAQAKRYVDHLPLQFSPASLWLAPLGAWSLARRQRRLFGLTFLIYLVDLVYALNYLVYNVEVYYLPSHLMVALWIGCGLRQTGAWLDLRWRRRALPLARRRVLNASLSGAALLILPITSLAGNWKANDHHNDWSALNYGRATLAALKPNAVVLAEGDSEYFPLLYPRFVEHRRPDVTLLELIDVVVPARQRLVTRHRGEGLKVVVPPRAKRAAGGDGPYDNGLLKQLIADNNGQRPIYLLCPPEDLKSTWMVPAMKPYCQVTDTNTPCLRLIRRPPEITATDPHPERRERIAFGPLRPGGGQGDDLELLGYDIRPLRRDGLPLLQMTYYWRLNNPAAARAATVWVLFTDSAGNYQRQDDGTPEFHNIHPLAYGLGAGAVKLPPMLEETFTLSVPPSEWHQALRIRMAVLLHGRFLPIRSTRSPWAEIGDLPPAAPGQGPRRLASAAPPREGE